MSLEILLIAILCFLLLVEGILILIGIKLQRIRKQLDHIADSLRKGGL